jgi:hypothetical protein
MNSDALSPALRAAWCWSRVRDGRLIGTLGNLALMEKAKEADPAASDIVFVPPPGGQYDRARLIAASVPIWQPNGATPAGDDPDDDDDPLPQPERPQMRVGPSATTQQADEDDGEAIAFDPAEATQFLHHWMEVTGVPHVTLVAILPDTKVVHARTFPHGSADAACAWVADHQRTGRNIYFQPNETRADCQRKPGKRDMVAALCRFADVDPDDAHVPLADERDRLSRLADALAAGDCPPTAIIDSGSGLQPIWAVLREALTPEVTARVEAETASLERALGAGGTHNVDRLLRLPGTLNFPTEVKRKKGRGISRARLIFASANLYQPDQVGALVNGHLGDVGLVRRRAPTASTARPTAEEPEVAALIQQLREAGGETIQAEADLPEALSSRLTAAMALDPTTMTDRDYGRRRRLGDRWHGMIDDLTEAGLDDSHSGADMSLAAMLKAAGFSHLETGLALLAFRHGQANNKDWPDETLRLRHVARTVLRSYEPEVDPPDPPPPPPPPPPEIDDPVLPFGVRLEDFWAHMPEHKYIFAPTRDLWPGASVNARLPPMPLLDDQGCPVLDEQGEPQHIPAAKWLDVHKPVEQMTWMPDQPMIIRNRLINEGAFIERPGVNSFNLYLPPPLLRGGDPKKATRWLAHLRRIYPGPGQAEHVCSWCAHRVQRPAVKINHALVLGGPQGIGKDTLLEPLKRALGAWNCAEISPKTLVDAPFNGFARSLLLRVSEARDLGEVNRYAFYEALKVYTAAPPDVLRLNEKHRREYHIVNCCGVVMTTNYKSGGIYLPFDDRRHYVVWSVCTKEDFSEEYWKEIWGWYEDGGFADVAAYLAGLDLSGFNPKAPPPQTPAFWEIVDANRAPEDSELADLLDKLGNPDCVTVKHLIDASRDPYGHSGGIGEWLGDRKNRRAVPHRMEQCGYVPVRNPAATDGLWKIAGKRQAIYAKATLSLRDQLEAAGKVTI